MPTSEPNQIDGLITFVFCEDLDEAHRFYHHTLALDMVRDQTACRIYRVGTGAFIGVCDHRPPAPDGVIVTIVSDAVDEWAERLRSQGHEVEGPHLNERFGIYHLFVRDPAGYLVEIQRFVDPL